MIIRDAHEEDNEALLELTRLSPMNGRISIYTSRGDNFFGLTVERGDCLTYVAEDRGKLVGCFSIAYGQAYTCGTVQKIGYLCDLKIHPEWRSSRTAYYMFRHALKNTSRSSLYWAISIAGNTSVTPLMKGRTGLPINYPLGRFLVCELLPLQHPPQDPKIRYAVASDSTRIVELLQQYYVSYELAPYFSEAEILKIIRESVKTNHILVSGEGQAINAVLILANVNKFKLNIITALPIGLDIITRVSSILSRVLPIPRLPKKGEPVKMLYIKALAGISQAESAMSALIQYGRYLTKASGCYFLCAAFHEKDPLGRLIQSIPRFTFHSDGHIFDLGNDPVKLEQIVSGIPYVDFSLI